MRERAAGPGATPYVVLVLDVAGGRIANVRAHRDPALLAAFDTFATVHEWTTTPSGRS